MKTRQLGASLIEVLVVMVLLTVGILSLVRLFPGGFYVNKTTETATLAARLAKQELSRYANSSATLMDGVVPAVIVQDANSPTGYYIRADLGVTPDDLSPGAAAPGIDPYYLSDINKYRWIKGETVRIPPPSPLGPGVRGSVYMLTAGPAFDYPGIDFSGAVVDSIAVYGSPLIRRLQQVEDESTPILGGPSQYAIDYDDGAIAFYPATFQRTFQINYSYNDDDGQLQSVLSQPIVVPAAGYPVWQPIYVAGGRNVVPGTDVVSRRFTRVPFPPSFSSDPYEYALVPRTGSVADFATMGVMIFNPLGRDYVETGAYGSIPFSAKIDYNVLDWRIIRDDRPMPAVAPYSIRLSLKNVLAVGDMQDDNKVYGGLWRATGAPSADVLVYSLANGAEVPRDQYTVDYREGLVYFTNAYGAANASGNYRILYKARGGWGVQVQKAASSYRRASGHGANLGYAEFYLGGGSAGGVATRMYFPPMDAGRTITIRDVWYVSRNSITGTETVRHATNETYKINSSVSAFEPVGPGRLTWIDLRNNHDTVTDRAVAWALSEPVQPAQGVQGISFKARTVWSDGGQVTKTESGNVARVRWRKIDLDTFLTRSPY